MKNEVVYNKAFGKGIIVKETVAESKVYIVVAFGNEMKEFVFPDSFEKYLEAESEELKARVRQALEEKEKTKKEVERQKEKEKAELELRKKQAEQKLIETKKQSSTIKYGAGRYVETDLCLKKGKAYGTKAIDIYEKCCEIFGFDITEKSKFGMYAILYSEIATSEGYSVWFLPHSINLTGTHNNHVENWIHLDRVEQWWFDKNHEGRPQKRKRLMFYKKNNVYYFGGVFLFDGNERIEEKGGRVYLVERFDCVSEVYPEKNNSDT